MFHNFRLDQKAISSSQIKNTLNWYDSLGNNSHQLLENTGIDYDSLVDDDILFTYRQYIKMIENMLASGLRPGIWLDQHRDTGVPDYGLLGYAMMSCGTLEQAVNIAVKYHRMAGAMFDLQFIVENEKGDGDAILRIDHLMAGGLTGQYLVEELFLSIPLLISQLLGHPHQAKELKFSYPKPDYSDCYEEVFNCPITFENAFCEYRFSAADLTLELSKADPNIARICEDSCRNLLNQMEIEQGLVSQICHILLSHPGQFPKLEVIANRMYLSTRTLRRRLQQLGTTYQQILDDVRHELATEYLSTTDLSVHEISDLLGFSEPTNFRRAYLKWAGESPYQYRKRHVQSIPIRSPNTSIKSGLNYQ